jgi:hypothetical protein
MHRVPSRALAAVGYDCGTRVLRIRFRHGGLYDYADVPESVYLGLRSSAHPWTEWGAHIKATYLPIRLE